MTHWGEVYSMCNAQDESPINIQTLQTINGPHNSICNPFFNWTVDFTKQTFKITNNGHSVTFKAAEATTIDPDNELDESLTAEDGTSYLTLGLNENTIATFPNYFKPPGSEHDKFCLDSFHFHWGTNDWTGSEHLVNDYQYPLEVHFVHYSCKHASLGSTLENFQTEDDIAKGYANGQDVHQLGVVGIFFEVVDDRTNPAFDAMFGDLHLYHVKYPGNIVGIKAAEIVKKLDLSQLIPQDIKTAGYYAYEGSLTTPPCTDIVRWFVMNAKGYIGRSQLRKFRELMSTTNHTIAPNFRNVQNNINDVYSCMASDDEEVLEDDKTARSVIAIYAVVTLFMPITLGAICCYKQKRERKLVTEIDGANKEKLTA